MLIDLSSSGSIAVDPTQYLTTLVAQVVLPRVTQGHPTHRLTCGVFAGRFQDFHPDEYERPVPILEGEEGYGHLFLLDRPDKGPLNRTRHWDYAVIGWDQAVYLSCPYVYTIELKEYNDGPGNHYWTATVKSSVFPLVRLVLPDYEPGATARLGLSSASV